MKKQKLILFLYIGSLKTSKTGKSGKTEPLDRGLLRRLR
jgi:hypothetical protein